MLPSRASNVPRCIVRAEAQTRQVALGRMVMSTKTSQQWEHGRFSASHVENIKLMRRQQKGREHDENDPSWLSLLVVRLPVVKHASRECGRVEIMEEPDVQVDLEELRVIHPKLPCTSPNKLPFCTVQPPFEIKQYTEFMIMLIEVYKDVLLPFSSGQALAAWNKNRVHLELKPSPLNRMQSTKRTGRKRG